MPSSIGLGDAAQLVVGLPMSPLALFAAVVYKRTSSAGRKLGSTLIPFACGTIAANLAIGIGVLLIFLFSRHGENARR